MMKQKKKKSQPLREQQAFKDQIRKLIAQMPKKQAVLKEMLEDIVKEQTDSPEKKDE
jgi:hypothetical protein